MEETSVLIARSQSGDKEARDVLIDKNLGLVRHILKRFNGRGYETEDLFQIGVIGLIKAIDKFNLDLGLQFSTYAVPLISGEIRRFLRDDGPIKVSRSIKENAFKIQCARQRLQNELGREPTIAEIAGASGLSEEDIVIAQEATAFVESIYAPCAKDDGGEMYLVDRATAGGSGSVGCVAPDPGDAEKERILNHLLLQQLMEQLDEREKELIEMRYFQNRTQTEVARHFGISQVQVSRMEKKILLRMRSQIA